MKIVEQMKLNSSQDVYDIFKQGKSALLTNETTELKDFEIENYIRLCEKAKTDTSQLNRDAFLLQGGPLTQEEKRIHFNLFRKLKYNECVIKNGEVVSLESIYNNFNIEEYAKLRQQRSKNNLTIEEKLRLYELMPDAQSLGIIYVENNDDTIAPIDKIDLIEDFYFKLKEKFPSKEPLKRRNINQFLEAKFEEA